MPRSAVCEHSPRRSESLRSKIEFTSSRRVLTVRSNVFKIQCNYAKLNCLRADFVQLAFENAAFPNQQSIHRLRTLRQNQRIQSRPSISSWLKSDELKKETNLPQTTKFTHIITYNSAIAAAVSVIAFRIVYNHPKDNLIKIQ